MTQPRHKLSTAEERRAKTNSTFRGGYIAVANFRGGRRPVRGVRSELVTTEGAAKKAAEDLASRTWHIGRTVVVPETCYFRVNALGDAELTPGSKALEALNASLR